jgi:hypothetical protein
MADWKRAQKAVRAASAAMADLQIRATAFAEALKHAQELSDMAWRELPVKPSFIPPTVGRKLKSEVSLYLYGQTNGALGHAGLSPHVIRQRPDLITQAKQCEMILLSPMEKEAA